MSGWTVAWLLWGLMFALIEGAALANDRREDTLSEHFQRWFNVRTHKGRTAWVIVSGVFFAWFVPHILGVSFG